MQYSEVTPAALGYEALNFVEFSNNAIYREPIVAWVVDKMGRFPTLIVTVSRTESAEKLFRGVLIPDGRVYDRRIDEWFSGPEAWKADMIAKLQKEAPAPAEEMA